MLQIDTIQLNMIFFFFFFSLSPHDEPLVYEDEAAREKAMEDAMQTQEDFLSYVKTLNIPGGYIVTNLVPSKNG